MIVCVPVIFVAVKLAKGGSSSCGFVVAHTDFVRRPPVAVFCVLQHKDGRQRAEGAHLKLAVCNLFLQQTRNTGLNKVRSLCGLHSTQMDMSALKAPCERPLS